MRRAVKWLRSWFTPDAVFEGQLPIRGSKEAAGLDICAKGIYNILPGRTRIIPTGIKCSFNPGWAALLWDRSSYGARGLHRFAGLIDSDYRGEWGVVIHNASDKTHIIQDGDRIAQVVFQRVWTGQPRSGDVTNNTQRGRKGWGSTGR